MSIDSLLQKNQEQFDKTVDYLSLKLQKPITTTKIVMLTAKGVKYLGKIKELTGPEKKELVLYAIKKVIRESPNISESDKLEISLLIDTIGNPLIDTLVEFAKDAYTFIKSKSKKWCPCTKKDVTVQTRSLGHIEEYNDLKSYLENKLQDPISASKMVNIIAMGIKYIESYKSLTGSEKKDIVIRAIRDIIQDLDLSSEDKEELISFIDTFADDTIDYLVDFGRNMYLKLKKSKCYC